MSRPAYLVVMDAGMVGICFAMAVLERGMAFVLVDRQAPGSGAWLANLIAGENPIVDPNPFDPRQFRYHSRNVPSQTRRVS